jgi:DNA-directed RNA polymerase subunit RPC12/RpoP
MSFILKCPACRKPVTIEKDLIGRLATCPHCSGYFSVAVQPGQNLPIAIAAAQGEAVSTRRRLTFSCQRCGSVLESIGERSGQPGRCPTCGAVFIVPPFDESSGRGALAAIVPDDGQLPTPVHAYATAGSRAPKIVRRENGEQVIVCPRCQREMPVDADKCGFCGMPFTLEGANVGGATAIEPVDNNLATAALTVGILAVLSFCLPILGPVAIGLGIAGVRRAAGMGPHGCGRKMAIAGIVLGSASIVLFVCLRLLGKW